MNAINPQPPLLVTAAVLRHAGRILLTQRPAGKRDAGLWEFPGGKLDPGETPEVCLQREMLEELGLQVAPTRLLEAIHHRYDWGDVLLLVYECHLLGGVLEHLDVADHRWVRPQDLTRFPLLPADLPLAQRLAAGSLRRLIPAL